MPKKMVLVFILKNFEKKKFIKSPYYERKKEKKEYTHHLSPTTPSHTTKEISP